VNKLKSQLRKIAAEKKSKSELDKGLPAFAPFKQDGVFKIATLEFNPDTGQAKVTSVRDAARNNTSLPLAEYESKKLLAEIFTGLSVHG